MSAETPAVAHTPVPWFFRRELGAIYTKPKGYAPEICDPSEAQSTAEYEFTTGEKTANALLIVASCNSYGKHFGPVAVSAAEEDLLGAALELLHFVFNDGRGREFSPNNLDMSASDEFEKCRAVLSRVKGGA